MLLWLLACTGDTEELPTAGTLQLLTYNVHGRAWAASPADHGGEANAGLLPWRAAVDR